MAKGGVKWAQAVQQYGLEFQIKTGQDIGSSSPDQDNGSQEEQSQRDAKENSKARQDLAEQAASFRLFAQVSRMELSVRYFYGLHRVKFPFTQ